MYYIDYSYFLLIKCTHVNTRTHTHTHTHKQTCSEYLQLRSDFLDDHLQPRATINSAVWMAAIEMAREAKEKQKNFEDLQ